MENEELKENPIEGQSEVRLPESLPLDNKVVRQFVERLQRELEILFWWAEVLLDSFKYNRESPDPDFDVATISREQYIASDLKFDHSYKDLPINQALVQAAETAKLLNTDDWLKNWSDLVYSFKYFQVDRRGKKKIPWHQIVIRPVVKLLNGLLPRKYKPLPSSDDDFPGPILADVNLSSKNGIWFRKMIHYVQICQVALTILDRLCGDVSGKYVSAAYEGMHVEGIHEGGFLLGATADQLNAKMSFIMTIKWVAFTVVSEIEKELTKEENKDLFEKCFIVYKREQPKNKMESLKKDVVKHMTGKNILEKSILEMCDAIHKAKDKVNSDSKQDLTGNVDIAEIQSDHKLLANIPVPGSEAFRKVKGSPDKAGGTSQASASGQEKRDQESPEGDNTVEGSITKKMKRTSMGEFDDVV